MVKKWIYILLILTPLWIFARSSRAQTEDINPAEEIFGKNFKLTSDPTSGTLEYNWPDEENKFFSIEAKRNVQLISDKLSLKCDELYYNDETRELKAVGEEVRIEQGQLTATCGYFTYEPRTGRSRLEKSPKIITEDEIGRRTITEGDTITIERRENSDTRIQVSGSATLRSEEGSKGMPKPEKAVAPAQKMFGRQFEITTGENGELLYSFNKDNELLSIVAVHSVFITSEDVDINCDRVEYFSKKNQLLAMGKPVKIFQQDIVAECGRFEYYPDIGKSLLLENPVILNTDEKGRTMKTRGKEIDIYQEKEGKTTILVKGKPQIVAEEAEKEQPVREEARLAPTPVDESTVDRIKNLDIVQD